jgi:hypothetical protein
VISSSPSRRRSAACYASLFALALASAGCSGDDGAAANGGASGSGAASGSGGTGATGGGAGSGGSGAGGGATGGSGGGTPVSSRACSLPPEGLGKAALPAEQVDVTWIAPTGQTHQVAAGGDLQAAIDAAQPGDEIVLEAGAVFSGPFKLPNKSGDGWILIRSSALSELPEGVRVSPSDAAKMAVIEAADGAITTADQAHHYRLAGLEIRPPAGQSPNDLVRLGSTSATSSDQLAHHIIIDRCYIHGDPDVGGKRGVALNSKTAAVIDSYLSDWKREGQDTQAIAGWNGPGPFLIHNNYLEGAAENVMFGGADPAIDGVLPSDIEICKNHFSKPLSWKKDDPSFNGKAWTIKNLFELKAAQRLLFSDNVLERSWTHGQTGFAFVLKSSNQDGAAPWVVTQDITIVNNLTRGAGGGINLSGAGDGNPAGVTSRLTFYNNLFVDIGGEQWLADGRSFQFLNGPPDVWYVHNTTRAGNSFVTCDGKVSAPGFVYRDNLVEHGNYGFFGSGTGVGNASLAAFFTDPVFEGNLIVGDGKASAFPANNAFAADWSAAGVVDAAAGNFRLQSTSPYAASATDGADPGADLDLLEQAISGVRSPSAP